MVVAVVVFFCFFLLSSARLVWLFFTQVEQLLSLEKSGYVCFSDYHTGFTGRFNIYDLVLEKPFFKGWYCHIIASFVKHLWPRHFLFLSANMIQNRYDLRKMCILLQLWKSEIGRFNLTSSWGLAPRNLQEIFNLHPEKMARGRGEGGQLNIFFLQNNFLWCLTFFLSGRRAQNLDTTFDKWYY